MVILVSLDILQNQLIGEVENGNRIVLEEEFEQDAIIKTKSENPDSFIPESLISEFVWMARNDNSNFYLGGRICYKIVSGIEMLIFTYSKYKKY